MQLSGLICMIVCVALNWGAAAYIGYKIQKSESQKDKNK